MGELNVGKGRCRGTARLPLTPVQAVIELGAAQDLLMKALNAVHHANRHADPDEFIAVALPGMRMGRSCMMPGFGLELIGSERALATYLDLEGPASLRRRGMILPAEIEEVRPEPGAAGTAYVRDRASAKRTPGWVRRSRARAERRGVEVGKPVRVTGHDLTALTLYYGRTVVHVRQVPGLITGEPLLVNTYGFSSAGAPAVLPVSPAITDGLRDAA